MRHIKRVFELLSYNFPTLLLFEVCYKLVTVGALLPLARALFSGLLWITGFRYLTRDNLNRFLLHPLVLLFFIVLALMVTLVSLVDIEVVILVLDLSYQRKRAGRNVRKVFPSNIALIGYMLFMIPFIHLGVSTGVVHTVARPEFIMQTIHEHWYYMVILYGGNLVIAFFLLRWLYIFHYFIFVVINHISYFIIRILTNIFIICI